MSNPVPAKLAYTPSDPLFSVLYKTGQMLNTQHFRCSDIQAAIRLAQDWCQIMNFRFINVAPFEVDLVAAIARQKENLVSTT